MASGIEHRTPDTILEAYQHYEKPNFSIWAGKVLRIKYEGGNVDEGQQELVNYLNSISAANTSTIYTLRVYDANTTKITDKTAYEGSTTFMLNPNQATANANGVTVIDRTSTVPAAVTAASKQLNEELQDLRKQNELLKDQIHEQRLQQMEERLEKKYEKVISGLSKKDEDQPWYEKLIDAFDKHGDKIEKIAGNLYNAIRGAKKNYIVGQNSAAVSGTQATTEADLNTQTTMEGTVIPFENPFLTEEEKGLKRKDQRKLMEERLGALTEDQLHEVQDSALESIASRITDKVLTLVLITVASLDDDDMNRLLNNLD